MTTGNQYLDYVIFVSVVLLASFILVRISRFFFRRTLIRAAEQLNMDPTRYYFLSNAIGFLIFLTAIMIILFSIPELKELGLTLFAGAGVLAAIIGFASQAAFSNIISGIFIVIFKPFRVGDTIKISNLYFGTVEDITLRHSIIGDIENKRFIIPNSVMSSEVIHNYLITDEKVANQIYFGVSYSANLDKVFELIRDEAEKHPNLIDNRTKDEISEGIPKIYLRVMEWAESSIQIRATLWSEDPGKGFDMKCDLLKSVKDRFDQEGIEIPYPHRSIILKNSNGQILT